MRSDMSTPAYVSNLISHFQSQDLGLSAQISLGEWGVIGDSIMDILSFKRGRAGTPKPYVTPFPTLVGLGLGSGTRVWDRFWG